MTCVFRRILFAAAVFLLPATAVHGAVARALQTSPCDAGEHYRFARVECDVPVYNAGDAPIRLSDIKAGLPTDRSAVQEVLVAPKATAYVRVSIELDKGVGFVNRYFLATSDEPGNPHYQLVARAFVNTVLDEPNLNINFGVVDAAGPLPTKSIRLSSNEVLDLRAKRVLSAPDYLDVTLLDGGTSISISPRKDIPWGLHDDIVKFEIDAPQQSAETIRTRIDVHGAVVPAENPVDVGLLRQGKANETLIRLTSANGKKFRVGKAQMTGLDASVDVRPCVGKVEGCALLHLTIRPTQPVGEIKGLVSVELPDYAVKLPIAVWGMMVKPETPVRSLDKDLSKGTGSTPLDSAAATKVPAVSVQDAIKAAVAPPAAAVAPPGEGPLLKWRIANEGNIHAYVIYRADTEQGPFLRINQQVIPSTGVGEEGALYQWRDTSATPGKTYWYQIGTIYNDGHKQQLTGPQRVVAK